MWFTENPWPPALICGVLAAVALTVWFQRQQSKWLLMAAGAILAAVAVWYIEKQIITEREQVELQVIDLVKSFEAGDEERVLNHFSPQAVLWRGQVLVALKLVKVKNLDVKDMSVQLVSKDTEAISHFRANGTVMMAGMEGGHQPSRWKLTWRKEKGDWKIIDVIRLNPLKDEPMGVLDSRAQ